MECENGCEELLVRYLLNIPEEEQEDTIDVCIRLEQALWFYNDILHGETKDQKIMTQLSKMLNDDGVEQKDFYNLKRHAIRAGCLIFNDTRTHFLGIRAPYGSQWSFPCGKLDDSETPMECAIRECLEEASVDVSPLISEYKRVHIPPTDSSPEKFIYFVTLLPFTEVKHDPLLRGEIIEHQWIRVKGIENDQSLCSIFFTPEIIDCMRDYSQSLPLNQ